MGTGASTGISAATKNASVEEISEVLKKLPEATRARLAVAFDSRASDADCAGWAPMNELFAALFAEADKNNNGAVSVEELEVFLIANPEWLDQMDCSKGLLFDMLAVDKDGDMDKSNFSSCSLQSKTDSLNWKVVKTFSSLDFEVQKIVVPSEVVDDNKSHFILCYGSLLNSESRPETSKASEFIYIIAKGFQNGWTHHAKHACKFDGGCFNGVIQTLNPSHEIWGFILQVPQRDLPAFDLREKIYKRTLVTDIQTLPGPDGNSHELPSNAAVWIYVDPAPKHPTTSYPILQTYIDIIVAGALEHSEDFARNVIRSMSGFQYSWKNDRGTGDLSSEGFFPQYKGFSEKSTSQAARIDQLLQEEVPEQLARRYLSTGPSGTVLDDGIA